MCSYFKLQLKSDMYVMYWLLSLKLSDFVDFVNIYNQDMIVNFNSDWDLINQSDYPRNIFSHSLLGESYMEGSYHHRQE